MINKGLINQLFDCKIQTQHIVVKFLVSISHLERHPRGTVWPSLLCSPLWLLPHSRLQQMADGPAQKNRLVSKRFLQKKSSYWCNKQGTRVHCPKEIFFFILHRTSQFSVGCGVNCTKTNRTDKPFHCVCLLSYPSQPNHTSAKRNHVYIWAAPVIGFTF